MTYTVHQLAELANISVRTLHYYDEIGLLRPAFLAPNGYRYYEENELILLQQILFFRELEFPLKVIKHMLGQKDYNIQEGLRQQKKLLKMKQNRTQKLIQTIDKTLKRMQKNQKMKDQELYDAFEDKDMKQYQDEVKERWGNSDAYTQSMKRVSKMTKKEMEKLKAKGIELTQKIAESMNKGIADPEVQFLIKKHHEGINFFYECGYDMYKNLGSLYVNDKRFGDYYEKFAPGLATFMKDAIDYYCSNHTQK
ncbi:MAG: MerR family transcriptional regulator [Candidatus Magasanikbacteria bacterium CG11_big_fil_rev_8_21_14_0_20_39_34]|uniref:MerR family transcriptional regulator n=1 Tax=Candidatus Magasanikbacteria bacterium CG11_big_fil_rev_8_21_14_0_20_39_34 TaxID=1974653 RepID=A0A2H0N5Y9_9BACT|nr:MAG: MerR family transcriptional regulator [Candidatus Magasanikbacteria bacterium CG11_big_fil_rev_8_21_14_0_20_39_34]